eukprot:1151364-Pelagomonas_calceolata.AAC.3
MKTLNHRNHGAGAGSKGQSRSQCAAVRKLSSKCTTVGDAKNDSSGTIRLPADVGQSAAGQERTPPSSSLGWRAAAGVATALSLMVGAWRPVLP